ncbi:MAG: hypothetical protein QXG10_00920 [Candidatus Hadarchaeales archaeon]
MANIPPEVAWLIPIVVPFIIGFLIGALVKKAFKMILILAALVVVLVVTGAIGLTFSDIIEKATQVLPKIAGEGAGLINIIPYTSITFIVGLILALWKIKS